MIKNQRQYNGAKTVAQKNGAGTTGHRHVKNFDLDTDVAPFTKINAKWIINLNVKQNYKTPRR